MNISNISSNLNQYSLQLLVACSALSYRILLLSLSGIPSTDRRRNPSSSSSRTNFVFSASAGIDPDARISYVYCKVIACCLRTINGQENIIEDGNKHKSKLLSFINGKEFWVLPGVHWLCSVCAGCCVDAYRYSNHNRYVQKSHYNVYYKFWSFERMRKNIMRESEREWDVKQWQSRNTRHLLSLSLQSQQLGRSDKLWHSRRQAVHNYTYLFCDWTRIYAVACSQTDKVMKLYTTMSKCVHDCMASPLSLSLSLFSRSNLEVSTSGTLTWAVNNYLFCEWTLEYAEVQPNRDTEIVQQTCHGSVSGRKRRSKLNRSSQSRSSKHSTSSCLAALNATGRKLRGIMHISSSFHSQK